MRWEWRKPFPSDTITTLRNNKSAFLLFLSFAKVSNTKDMLNRQTCQGILVSPPSHLSPAFHGVEPHRGEVFVLSKSHSAVWCGFDFLIIVRSGAVRFPLFQNHTVWSGAVLSSAVRCGSVRCGLYFSRIIRCGAVRLSFEQLIVSSCTVRLSVYHS